MSELQTQATDLLAKVQADLDQRHARWRQEYRTILLRSQNPHPKDAARLGELLDDLGLDSGNLQADLAKVEQAAAMQAIIDTYPDLDESRADAAERWSKYDEETRRIIQERKTRSDELHSAIMRLGARIAEVNRAKFDLHFLKQANKHLFGD